MGIINTRNKLLIIIAMVICYAFIFIDESGIAVTLPQIQQSLNLTNNSVSWVINSYLLTLSVLLLLGGKLSDIYGKRRVFILGTLIFLIGSVICALASNIQLLLIGQVVLGVGASLLMPCITIIIQKGFPGDEFGKAFGLILGFSNFFYAVGPFIGGALTEYLNWRWFFWLNIPLGIICILFTALAIEKDQNSQATQLSDSAGIITFILALTALVFALMQGAVWGWSSTKIISLFLVALILLIAYIVIELKACDPLLEIRLFLNKLFAVGNLVLFCSSICLTAIVYWALWLQSVLNFSPSLVGLALLPTTFTFIFIPSLTGAWQDKAGARSPMLAGASLVFFGLVWIGIVLVQQNYFWLLPGLLAFGIGVPLVVPSSIVTIMTSVPAQHAGMASGTFTTVRQLGLSIGIAILSAVISSYNNSHLAKFLQSHSEFSHLNSQQINLLLAGKNTVSSVTNINLLKQSALTIYTHAQMAGMLAMIIFSFIALASTWVFVKK